jgi:phosphatidate cytidylyltransferase
LSAAVPSFPGKWSDLGVRAFSAAVLIPAVLLDVWLGGIWFKLFVALVAILMAYEWTVLAHESSSLQFALHCAAALCGTFLPTEIGVSGALIGIAVLTVLSIIVVQLKGRTHSMWTSAGVPYVSLSAAALIQLRMDDTFGTLAILWILAVVWAADTFAYFAGKSIGGPKLAPRISPNKTWAGFSGAIAGALAVSAIFAAVAELQITMPLLVAAGIMAIVEQGGDLFKSAFKRYYGVKDTGRLIPGHGGVIDRVDGLVAVAMAAALLGTIRAGSHATGQGLLVW